MQLPIKCGWRKMKQPKKPTLPEALLALLPGSEIARSTQTEWRSATFSGHRFSIAFVLSGIGALDRVQTLQANLPDHEFDLRRYVVADIIVEDIIEAAGMITFRIEALLLDD
jgi:hypothetical protein